MDPGNVGPYGGGMDVVVVGSGVAGSIASLLLARGGHAVTVVDRDPGPVDGQPWDRVGVMQFHQPHTWRAPTRNVLRRDLPDVLQLIEAAGAVAVNREGAPEHAALLLCRREVLERQLWLAVARETGVRRVVGHADAVVVANGRAAGVLVDGTTYAAELVVDASGRAGRLSRPHRGAPLGGSCEMDYTSQVFRLRPGAEPGPMNAPIGHLAFHRGYQAIVFLHDAGTFSALLIRPSHDRGLSRLREPAAFAAATATIPHLADWVAPERSEPIGPVLTGGGLTNLYAGQPDLPGLVAIGDALATTNPNGARGGSLAADGAAALAATVAADPGAPEAWHHAMAAWSESAVRPWWADHVAVDSSLHRRWRGMSPDPDAFVSSDLVAEAIDLLPELMAEVGPYFGMLALPASLDAARERVRELIRSGWSPTFPEAPDRDALVAAIG